MANRDITVAVIDSFPIIRYAFSHNLKALGFNVTIEAQDAEDFIARLEDAFVPMVCVLNIDTPLIDEFLTARIIKVKYPHIKIVAYTVYDQDYREVEEYGIDFFLDRNCSEKQLESGILRLTKNASVEGL